jgi:hypothetical protein
MMLQLRLGPLYEELLAVASERGMSSVAMARQMIQESIRRVGEPAREEHRPEPPAPSPWCAHKQIPARFTVNFK